MRWSGSEIMARLLPSGFGGTSGKEGASEPLARDSDIAVGRDEYLGSNKTSLAPPCPALINQRSPIYRSSRSPTMQTNPVSECHDTGNTGGEEEAADDTASKPVNDRNNQPTPAAVRAAVAIAAGKKGVGMERSNNKKPVSRTLCLLYWLLVVATCSLISFTIWLSVQLAHRQKRNISAADGTQNHKTLFSMDDVFNSSFQPKSFVIQWINDTTYAHLNNDKDLILHNVATNTTTLLIDRSLFDELSTTVYAVSYDTRYVLLTHSIQRIWKYSFLASYTIFDTRAKRRNEQLIDFPLKSSAQAGPVQCAKWAPTSHALSFTLGGNLFHQENPAAAPTALTQSGDNAFIFHGSADWLYEEAVLGATMAHWWSPDSRMIAYATFNTSLVHLVHYPYYGPNADMFGSWKQFSYPKASDGASGNITAVALHVVELSTRSGHAHKLINPPVTMQDRDHYVSRLAWKDRHSLGITWLNRAQNMSITTLCSVAADVVCTENHYLVQHHGWIDPWPAMMFIKGGASYLTVVPRTEGNTGQWCQLAQITAPHGEAGSVTFLTRGQKDVLGIVGFDASAEIVYYLSTNGDPLAKHLMKVSLSGTEPPECLTCDSSDCRYVDVSASTEASYCVLGCLGPAVPSYKLLHHGLNTKIVFEDNSVLNKLLQTKVIPVTEYMNVSLGGGNTGYAKVLLPIKQTHDGNPRHKYPLLVNVMGSPEKRGTTYQFSLGLETFLVSTHRIVSVSVDGRGSGSQGINFRHGIYRKMGDADVEDQLLVAQWLLDHEEYINKAKAPAILGWSYGGFVAAHAVANDTNIFPCGVMGAAFTDLQYYDSTRAERLMGFADLTDNFGGFEAADVRRKVEYMRGKIFLMIHNAGDGNVRLASSAKLMQALTDANIQFRTQLYYNMHHHTEYYQRHLFELITDFLVDTCWTQVWQPPRLIWGRDPGKERAQFLRKEICV